MRFEELLSRNGVSRETSIFSQASDALMMFDLPNTKDALPCAVQEEQCLSVQPIAVTALQKSILAELEEYRFCCHELERISRALKKSSDSVEHLRSNRVRRKELMLQKEQLEEYAAEQSRMHLFGMAAMRKTLCWKGVIYATTVSSLCAFLPQLDALSMENSLRQMPVFTDRIAQWKQRMTEGYRFAVEGGPCLFGADEASVLVQMHDGAAYTFDFATEREATEQMPCLSQFAAQNAGMGAHISFCFSKTALTEAEYSSLLYVLEVAAAFGVDAYIPLPDFSYEKYMNAILETLLSDQTERETARRLFHGELCKVTELYLQELQVLQRRYPEVRVTVIHAESFEERQIYEEKRAAFINYDSHMIKTLTTIAAKRESIIDYITMPALPYYLDGVTEIIQVDCIDETDSYRKCQKLHRGAITLYPFLYPEALSSDGEHTVYYAKREHKSYREGMKEK